LLPAFVVYVVAAGAGVAFGVRVTPYHVLFSLTASVIGVPAWNSDARPSTAKRMEKNEPVISVYGEVLNDRRHVRVLSAE